MKKILLLLLLATGFISKAQKFQIEGASEGIADGTWLCLAIFSDQKIDSSQVINNKFSFSGRLIDKVAKARLSMAKSNNYVDFWIEPTNMTIALKKDDFKNMLVKGSATQEEEQQIWSEIKPLRGKRDSLFAIKKNTTDEMRIAEIWSNIDKLAAIEIDIHLNHIKAHPNSMVSVTSLNIYKQSIGKKKTEAFFKKLGSEMKQSKIGKEIDEFIRINQDIQIGGKYADFELPNANGKKIKLSEIRGRYILLEFWGSWCMPCRKENPNLVKIYQAFKDKGFNVLGVASDTDKKAWTDAIKKDQLPWENVNDFKGGQSLPMLIYGINEYPTNFLVDEKGNIIAKNLRGDDLRKKLEELLP